VNVTIFVALANVMDNLNARAALERTALACTTLPSRYADAVQACLVPAQRPAR
jgi:hypothetical protein